jgi:hypothetical protein
MAQVWHTERRARLVQQSQASYWRAGEYQLEMQDEAVAIEAVPGAKWFRYDPFSSYRPKGKHRDTGAGAHVQGLKLHQLWEEESDLFQKALLIFTREHGLLGIFEEDYLTFPVLPDEKIFVAPEAVIEESGELRLVEPATEGKELLLKSQESDSFFEEFPEFKELRHEMIAMPDEVRFTPKVPHGPFLPNESADLQHWSDIKQQLGGLLVLDEGSFLGASVICSREPLLRWSLALTAFTNLTSLTSEEQAKVLNGSLVDASPFVRVSEDGALERSYQCPNLLTAMYLMYYLDVTGGSTIKKCESIGCPKYFRTGAQGDSKYCSERCANRASTRRGRGLIP